MKVSLTTQPELHESPEQPQEQRDDTVRVELFTQYLKTNSFFSNICLPSAIEILN